MTDLILPYREIPLTQGKVALVDEEDYERAAEFKWYATFGQKLWYAVRHAPRPSRHQIQLHRFILEPPAGMVVDHKSGDGLDCRRANMRVCTVAQNTMNGRRLAEGRWASGHFVGVVRCRSKSPRWAARVGRDHIGTFRSPEDAARARDREAVIRYGEFAILNLPA